MTTKRRRQADRQLGKILSRVKYTGPEPPPSEDEIMDRVADEVRVTRAERLLPGEAAAIDAALAEGLADVRAGRVSPSFKSMKEFEAWLKTSQGREFGIG